MWWSAWAGGILRVGACAHVVVNRFHLSVDQMGNWERAGRELWERALGRGGQGRGCHCPSLCDPSLLECQQRETRE